MLMKYVVTILIIIFSVQVNADSPFLLSHDGWYKTRKRSDKKVLENLQSFGPDKFPTGVTYLKIGGSVIRVLKKNSFHDLENLQDLVLSSTGVMKVQPGAFQNVPKLSRLYLKDNEIQRIEAGVFNNLNITVLLLNRNQIKTIESGAFDDMPRLTKIKLNSNNISIWDPSWFKRTPSLTTVLIRRNHLKELPQNAFRNLIKDNNYTDLRLYFSKNRIRNIHPEVFKGLTKIGHLFLDRNRLIQLPDGVLEGVQYLHVLNIARNNLTTLPNNLLSTVLKPVKTLDVSSNPRLVCIPVDVVKLVSSVNIERNPSLDCSCVHNLRKSGIIITSENVCNSVEVK